MPWPGAERGGGDLELWGERAERDSRYLVPGQAAGKAGSVSLAVEDARGRGREVPSPGRGRQGVLSFSLGKSRAAEMLAQPEVCAPGG